MAAERAGRLAERAVRGQTDLVGGGERRVAVGAGRDFGVAQHDDVACARRRVLGRVAQQLQQRLDSTGAIAVVRLHVDVQQHVREMAALENRIEHAGVRVGRRRGTNSDLDRVDHRSAHAVTERTHMRDEVVFQPANVQARGVAGIGDEHRGTAAHTHDERVGVAVGGVVVETLEAQQDREETFEVVDDSHTGLA